MLDLSKKCFFVNSQGGKTPARLICSNRKPTLENNTLVWLIEEGDGEIVLFSDPEGKTSHDSKIVNEPVVTTSYENVYVNPHGFVAGGEAKYYSEKTAKEAGLTSSHLYLNTTRLYVGMMKVVKTDNKVTSAEFIPA